MSIKTILVPLDELPRCHLRVELAAWLAQQHGAHLVGLSPTGLFEMPVQLGKTLGGATDYIQLSSNYLDQRAREIATEFNLETAVGRARAGRHRVCWLGATTTRAQCPLGGATPPARPRAARSGA